MTTLHESGLAVGDGGTANGRSVGNGRRRLALVEVFERDGRVGRAVDVLAWPLTIGRALDNDIVLDDAYIAPQHARIAPVDGSANDGGHRGGNGGDSGGGDSGAGNGGSNDGAVALHALASRNGVDIDGKRLAGGQTLELPAAGAALQIGATRLRLRLPAEVLVPEKPLPGIVPGQRARLAVMALALLAVVLAGQWIGLDPNTDTAAWLPLLAGLPLALAGWCGAWALMSKLFQHRFDFSGHLRIAIPWLLAVTLTDQLLPQAAAALGWPWLWQLSGPVQTLLAALMVRAHLSHVLPLYPRAVTAAVASVAIAASAISLARTWRAQDSLSAAPYMSTLPLPALRLGSSAAPSALVQDMAPLAAQLAQRVKKAREDDNEADPEDAGDE